MEIIGKYQNQFGEEYTSCTIRIEEGYLSIHTNEYFYNINLRQPKNDQMWIFRKIKVYERKPVEPTLDNIFDPQPKCKYSHVIEYETDNGYNQIIFINPTTEEKIEIKSQQDTWWLLTDKNFNKNLILVLLAALLALLIAIYT